MEKLKIQFIGMRIPMKEWKPDLFYYDLRDSEFDDGYIVERRVLANHIGSINSNKDILGDKKFISDEELEKMEYEEVINLIITK